MMQTTSSAATSSAITSSAIAVDRTALASHYKEVESFQAARARSIRHITRILGVVSAIAILGNLAQAWTIAAMLPLARIVPVYLWVRPDGTIDSSVSMSRLPGTQNEAVINASLWEYVQLREGYSYDTARYAYDIVSSYSAPLVRSQYQTYFNYPNPASPQVIIGQNGTIQVIHISSSNLAPEVQQIRYQRIVALDNQEPMVTTWTATIHYVTVRDLPPGVRLTNPGGVLVTNYQISEDTPG
jgi:type IV secretion system protein VirB8